MDESHRYSGHLCLLLLDWPWIDSGWTQCYRNQWRIYEVEPRAHDMADLYYRRICSYFIYPPLITVALSPSRIDPRPIQKQHTMITTIPVAFIHLILVVFIVLKLDCKIVFFADLACDFIHYGKCANYCRDQYLLYTKLKHSFTKNKIDIGVTE